VVPVVVQPRLVGLKAQGALAGHALLGVEACSQCDQHSDDQHHEHACPAQEAALQWLVAHETSAALPW
jgi:hypothetical protein